MVPGAKLLPITTAGPEARPLMLKSDDGCWANTGAFCGGVWLDFARLSLFRRLFAAFAREEPAAAVFRGFLTPDVADLWGADDRLAPV